MKHKPKFAGLAIALGATLGVIAGAMVGNTGAWLAIGVAIGIAIGVFSRRKTPDCPECEALHRTHELRSRANSQVGWKL